MNFLFAKEKKVKIHEITGVQIQSAINVVPIPILYGSPRVQVNIIYINGFRHVTTSSSGEGKGVLTGGKGSGTDVTTYYATFIAAIGEGDLKNVIQIYDNQSIYAFDDTPTGRALTFFDGSHTQPAWSYIVSHWPADAFTYKDTCYLGGADYKLDSSGTVPQMNYLVAGTFSETSPLNRFTNVAGSLWFLDADPAQCVYDFLTNSRYGVGFPAAYIDTTTLDTSDNGYLPDVGDAALSTYCQAVGFAWSVVINTLEPASSLLDRLFKNLVVAPVWTGAILKFIPYWNSYSAKNPNWNVAAGVALKYYQPGTTALFDFSDADFVQTPQEDDPVVITRVDVADVKNVVRVDFRDRFNEWNDNVAEAKDEESVELYGSRVQAMGTADEFNDIPYATACVNMQLWRNITIRRTFQFKLPPQWCILDPMDVVTITETTLGLHLLPIRIVSIEEDEKGVLSIVAEDFPDPPVTTIFPAPTNNATVTSTNVIPAAVNSPFIFEPTSAMLAAQSLGSSPLVMMGVCAGPAGAHDPNWGGCNVYLSNDNVTYTFATRFDGPSRMGETTASLAAYTSTNPDNTNTLSVDLSESAGTLEASATPTQAAAGKTLCAIQEPDGSYELLSYETATLTGANTYDLTGLWRGLYGTRACSHLSGSKFIRIDSVVASVLLDPAFIAHTVYVKLQSYNIFNQSPQDLSTCTAYTYVPRGTGTNVVLDPIISALLAGTSVDLMEATVDTVDLNYGGAAQCAPIITTVDLGLV